MVLLLVATAALSILCCGAYLRLARRLRIYDVPNARSAHSAPVPGGGGVGLFVALLGGVGLAALFFGSWNLEFQGLLALAAMLVLLGMVDDVSGLSARLRLLAYALVCVCGALALGLPLPLWVLAALFGLTVLNLYNFMDGMDGLAATETLFVCLGAALLSWWWAGPSQYALFCLLLAAAVAGFLTWNWPPARLFMGDAGSVSIGFMLAGLAVLGEVREALPLATWLVLLAAFITDSMVTLVWRMSTGQAFTQAHNLHLYQRLGRHWGSHRPVNLLLAGINLGWLLPLAAASVALPDWRWPLLGIAYLPLLLGMSRAARYP